MGFLSDCSPLLGFIPASPHGGGRLQITLGTDSHSNASARGAERGRPFVLGGFLCRRGRKEERNEQLEMGAEEEE